MYGWVFLMLMVKRLHDLNRSGWYLFTFIIPLVGQIFMIVTWIEMLFVGGHDPNRFGSNPNPAMAAAYEQSLHPAGITPMWTPGVSDSQAGTFPCARCGAANRKGAHFCNTCGNPLPAWVRGYCDSCQKTMEIMEPARCPTCLSDLTNVEVITPGAAASASAAAGALPPPGVAGIAGQPAPSQAASSPAPSSGYAQYPEPEGVKVSKIVMRTIIVLAVALITIGAIFLLNRSGVLDRLSRRMEARVTPGINEENVLEVLLATDTPSPTDTPAATPTPTTDPITTAPRLPEQAACMQGSTGGMVCIGAQGWVTDFGEVLNFHDNGVYALAKCPDGSVLIGSAGKLLRYTNPGWEVLPSPVDGINGDLACGTSGEIWIAGYSGVEQLKNGNWVKYPREEILGSDTEEYAQAVAISPDGSAWIAYTNSLAHYQDGAWTITKEGQGFNKEYYLQDVAVDSQGVPWVAYSNGLLTLRNEAWKQLNLSSSYQVNTLEIDDQDRIWAGTSNNVWVYENGNWRSYIVERSGISSSDVQALALDDAGRIWAGTDLGLSVIDERGKVTTYHMHTSPLQDNTITKLLVLGGGPPLPELVEEAPGAIRGKFLIGGQPMAKAKVEACQAPMGTIFSGSTPCSGKPFAVNTTTDENGEFILENLPEGDYSVAVRTPDGWKTYSCNMCFGAKSVPVRAGETVTLDTIDMK